MSTDQAERAAFLAPRFWPTWLAIGFLRLLALLPFDAGLRTGRCLGHLFYLLARRRRHITEVNIRLCFPERDAASQRQLVKDVFRANGMGLVESAWSWWWPRERLAQRLTVVGEEHLRAALEKGRGVVLLGAHFSTLDLGATLMACCGVPFATMYRPHNNRLMDRFITRGRARHALQIERRNFRQVLRSLRQNMAVWYAPDQDFGRKGAVFVPFFGQSAATITATTRLVALNESPLVLVAHYRNADNYGYTLEFVPVEEFPGADETQDAAIVNRTIETAVRKAPEQYMWMHRRFKTQQDRVTDLYRQ